MSQLPSLGINGKLKLIRPKQEVPETPPVYVGAHLTTVDQELRKEHRVYCAAVILPKDSPSFQYHLLKSSDHVQCLTRRGELSDYIKSEAVAWAVFFARESGPDTTNSSTSRVMHDCIEQVKRDYDHQQEDDLIENTELSLCTPKKPATPYLVCVNKRYGFQVRHLLHVRVEKKTTKQQSDEAALTSIVAASILAQNASDAFSLAADWYPETSWPLVKMEDPYGLFVGVAPETPWPITK